MTPTPAQLRALLQHHARHRRVAVHSPRAWTGEATLAVGELHWRIQHCATNLQLREQLADHDPDTPLLLLTPLTEADLEQDILARLARRRIHRIDPWDQVRQLFQARDIDPRLIRDDWLAEVLLEQAPVTGYQPVASGFLDLDSAWQALLARLGLPDGAADPLALLEWSLADTARPGQLAPPLLAGLRQRLRDSAGDTGVLILDTLLVGKVSPMAVGLVAEVLFPGQAPADPLPLATALGRLEDWLGGHALTAAQGRAWFGAASTLLVSLDEARQQTLIQQAGQLLENLKLQQAAGASSLLPAGFDMRLAALAEALDGDDPQALARALAGLRQHREADHQAARLARLAMAERLWRFLRRGRGHPTELRALVEDYVKNLSFVDQARDSLLGGDPLESLAAALERLATRARDYREALNERFAAGLAGTSAIIPGIAPVEDLLDRVLTPLVRAASILLIVADGMSLAVFRALAGDLERLGWQPLTREDIPPPDALLATVPSVTEFSRASLLAGQLTRGLARDEKRAFANHIGIRAGIRGSPPRLFHKGELLEGGTTVLAGALRQALANPRQRVVGVVLNAVDDALSGTAQLHPDWSLAGIRYLGDLLHEARLAGRTVVLTSDHGHVLETGSRRIPGDGGERWRADIGEPGEGEMRLAGPRVLVVNGQRAVIVPWSERLRYCNDRRAGYHGGVSLQEMLVPLAVLGTADRVPEGYRLSVWPRPEWWDADTAPAAPSPSSAPPARPGQATLFESLEDSLWIDRLLASPILAQQQRRLGHGAPELALLRRCLEILEAHRYRIAREALGRALQLPPFQLRGALAQLDRLLAVDGYHGLTVDAARDEVRLHRPVLERHFEI